MRRVECNRCGSEIDAGLSRCERCGASAPVVWGDQDTDPGYAGDDATVVSASPTRPVAEPGERVLNRYEVAGDPRPDLWGAYLQAVEIGTDHEVTLLRLERGIFRQRPDIDRFRKAQQALAGVVEPALVTPRSVSEWSGHWYLVYAARLSSTLRDAAAASHFRGALPDNVRRLLDWCARYVEALAHGGPRLAHFCLRPSAVFVAGREMRAAQAGFAGAIDPDIVARRVRGDAEAAFFAAPEVARDGRGSPRSDLWSLARLVGFAVSGRLRAPLFKGFQIHPDLKRALAAMAASDESQRPADMGAFASELRALSRLPEPIRPDPSCPTAAAAREGTAEVDADEIEAVGDGFDGTGVVAADEIEAVEGTLIVGADDIEPVEGTLTVGADDIEPVEASVTRKAIPGDASASAKEPSG
ncbi:MAG: hypothetical protein QME96_18040, partial [Myxococcota bacterium]|nr:hypothetical protein [Myxococcota bacterium]